MAVRRVLKMGEPVLYRRAEPVKEFGTPELDRLIEDMFDTMAAYNGAGLAAPQIGVSLRLVIFGVKANPRYPQAEPVPETILINPVIHPIGNEQEEGWEGCLSVPGMRGLVGRHRTIRYTGYDRHGAPIDRTVSGFHARVVQHECDHIDGVLYPMRLKDLRLLGYEDVLFPELEKKSAPAAEAEL
ncbi:peptide deformylase [Sulfurifustis variabilis]|uniref:Peptide deformylase n=1 Tax=Sulfurifustis variabilis TaxID=1675686 RepID=A0A1B4V7J5_9GAMM|nr:peptide deformylase [Sulfurifustis variabilis]BAU48582.1 peptide deformylase [Sulfurifustis variabilis]